MSYRKAGVDDDWREHLVKRHSFVVRNTSTFTPYEIKIQSRNSHGWGPEPKTVSGYSGEDGEWGEGEGTVTPILYLLHLQTSTLVCGCVPTQPSFGIVCGKMCQVKFFFLPSPCLCSSDFASPQDIKKKKKIRPNPAGGK